MEKYSRIFKLPEKLYAKGLPVIISAGALLKDNETNQVLVQLKICNISNFSIKAIRIKILSYDIAHRKLDDNICYEYLDLNIPRNMEFGQKVPIILSDNRVREFDVIIDEIVYVDNTVVSFEKIFLESLEPPRPLKELLHNEEIKYFENKYGKNCMVFPQKIKDLWFCACGTINHSIEENCICCGNKYFDFGNNEYAILKNEIKEIREKLLQKENRRQQQQKQQKEKQQKKIKIGLFCILLIVSFLLGGYIIYYKPQQTYLEAQQLLENKDYKEASQIFSDLGNYRDSESYAAYAEGMLITVGSRSIQEAYLDFLAAGSVEDAESYANALENYADNLVGTYREIYSALGGYIIINEDLEVEVTYAPEEYDSMSYKYTLVGRMNRISQTIYEIEIVTAEEKEDGDDVVYSLELLSELVMLTNNETQTNSFYEPITEKEYLIAVEAAK